MTKPTCALLPEASIWIISGGYNRLNLHFDALAEERHNGTLLTNNSTGLGTISANYEHSWQKDQIAVIAYHTRERIFTARSLQFPRTATLNASRYYKRFRRKTWAEPLTGSTMNGNGTCCLAPMLTMCTAPATNTGCSTLHLNHNGGTLLQRRKSLGQADVK